MSANIVEVLSRHAAQSVTRRGSLLTLGGALAAAVAAPSLARAEKNKKKARKKARKKAEQKANQNAENEANQVCESQIAGCKTQVLALCSLPGGKCFAAAECCSSLGACNVTEFFTCIVSISASGS